MERIEKREERREKREKRTLVLSMDGETLPYYDKHPRNLRLEARLKVKELDQQRRANFKVWRANEAFPDDERVETEDTQMKDSESEQKWKKPTIVQVARIGNDRLLEIDKNMEAVRLFDADRRQRRQRREDKEEEEDNDLNTTDAKKWKAPWTSDNEPFKAGMAYDRKRKNERECRENLKRMIKAEKEMDKLLLRLNEGEKPKKPAPVNDITERNEHSEGIERCKESKTEENGSTELQRERKQEDTGKKSSVLMQKLSRSSSVPPTLLLRQKARTYADPFRDHKVEDQRKKMEAIPKKLVTRWVPPRWGETKNERG